MSFELPEAVKLEQQMGATAWTIRDVRDYDQSLPIGVMTLPPTNYEDAEEETHLGQLYSQARRVYTGLGATILTESNIGSWAEEMAQRVLR